MKVALALFFLFVCYEVRSQCYGDSDISIQLYGSSNNPNQCLANYTIIDEDRIYDKSGNRGVNCSKRDSTANGTWTFNGSAVDCVSHSTRMCVIAQGSTTLYSVGEVGDWPNGIYKCCIEGSCISIRIYQKGDFNKLFKINDAVIESCSITPPSDLTVISQQYTVQMVTSRVPPQKLTSNIECTSNCDGTTDESYYTLIDLAEERYQYSRPVTWSPDTNSDNPQYSCKVSGTTKALTTSIRASNAPTIISYEAINATAVRIYWNITGDVNGFVINITSSGLSTVTQQLTGSSTREFLYNGILPERSYTIEVRGYVHRLGPADTTTVRLKAGISSIEVSLLSVSGNDLSTRHVEVNCFTFRVEPYEVNWNIDSELITPNYNYLRMNGSELLDRNNQTYRQYISLEGSFSNGTMISCSTDVNGETAVEEYVLKVASSPPTGLSARISSHSILIVSWSPVSNVKGYILHYNPNDEGILVNGGESSSCNIDELTQGTTYQINVYSYRDLPSESSNVISVLYDAPLMSNFNASMLTPSSIIVSWTTSNSSITDNYTVLYTRLCDNIRETLFIDDGSSTGTIIDSLYPGLQYSVHVIAANLLGRTTEKAVNVTLEGTGSPTGSPLLQTPEVINSTAVRLSWEEVNCTQRNGTITGYIVQYYIEGGEPMLTVNVLQSITSIVISNLTESSFYYIRIAAINNKGMGPYSEALGFYTAADTSTSPDSSSSSSSAVVAAGAAVGSIIFLLVVITMAVLVLVIVLRWKRSLDENQSMIVHYSKYDQGEENLEMDETKKPLDAENYSYVNYKVPVPVYEAVTNIYAYASVDVSNGLYTDPSEQGPVLSPYDPMIPETCPVALNDFGLYVSKNHSNLNSGFREQFKTLYTGEERSCAIGQGDQYKLLNRFKNITVYDDNRIVLGDLPTKVDYNEFINGSYVHGYSIPRKYIATQGPLLKTVGDFWHMVWQEKVHFIVTLTNLVEENKKKCARYWPEEVNSSSTYGHFNVTYLEEEPMLNFIIRTLRVELMGTSDSVTVKHYQYITWPDYGVPESVSPFMTLNRRVMSSWSKDKGPILVHCSAGVGRTGTFIAVDMALEQAEKERKVDIAGIVNRVREQRMKMVQTDAQYAFIHDAVLEAIVVGSTEVPVELFEAKVRSWRQPSLLTGTTPIQTQFQLLDLVTPDENDVNRHAAEKFPEKNRSMKFLPPEKWRVVLRGESPDYIHATFIHGYREKKAFILAQSPMRSTVREFLKMTMSYKVSAIVMCCEEQENGRETCFRYWDENRIKAFDNFFVEVKLVTRKEGFIQRDLKIWDKRNAMNVTLFQFTEWPESGVFTEKPQVILQVLDDIGRIQRRSGKGPVIVHCSDTVGRSGVFCAVSNAIEQFKTETIVDVFQATKAVRMHKPRAVNTLEQYDFIHDIILRYLEQNSSYSNFQANF